MKTSRTAIITFIAFVLSFAATVANATTYYVSTSGSDSNNGTSTSTPWADLSVSVGKLNAGDTLLLKRGDTFNETSVVEVNDANVTIGCFGDPASARPVWSGQSHQYPGGMYAPQLRFGTSTEGNNSGSGGKVSCISFQDSSGFSVQATSDNVTINDVESIRAGTNGLMGAYGADNVNITNSFVSEANYGYEHRNDDGFYGDKYGTIVAWGSSVSVRGNGHLVANNRIIKSTGEAIIALDGSQNVVIRDNYIEGGKVGIYAVGSNILVDSNIMYKIPGYSYPTGIGINNEPISRQRAIDRGNPVPASDVVITNNLIAGFKTCFWLADEIGGDDANFPTYGYTTYGKITIAHNHCIDNERGIKFDNTGSWAQTVIRNNVFHEITDPVQADMIYGSSVPAVLPTINNNYFTVAPVSGAGATGNITSGLTITKTSGWRTAVSGGISSADFETDGASTTDNAAVLPIGNGITRTTDYFGNTVDGTPNVGAFEAAGAPGGGGSSTVITHINGGSNEVTASEEQSFTGTGLKGVYGGIIADSDSNQALSKVVGLPDSLSGRFTTDDLTGINTGTRTVSLYHDTPVLYSANPRTWTANFSSSVLITNAAPAWIFDSGIRIATNLSGTGNTALSAPFAVTTGDVLDIECYYSAGTSSDMRFTAINGAGNRVRFGSAGVGNHNNQTPQANTAGTSISNFSETLMYDQVYRGVMHFTANYTGNYQIEFGADTSTNGGDVVLHDCRVWKNRVQNATTFDLITPFAATLSNLNTDNIIDPISAANGSNLFALSGNIGGVSIPFLTPNVGGSVATFKSPDLSGLANGNQTLTLNVAQPTEISHDPISWATNSGTMVKSSYTGTHLGYGGGAKITIGSGGAEWNGFKINSLFTVAAGDVIEQWVDVVQQTGGRVKVALVNESSGGFVDFKGIFGALASSGSSACSENTLTEQTVEGMTRIKITCTSAAAGSYGLVITPDSGTVGDAVVVLGRTTFVNASPIAKTLTVTNPGGIVPEPEPVKTLKLGTPLSKITRNGVPANFTYTSVKVYDKNPATDRTAQVLVELVGPYDEVLQEYEGIAVVNGIASATEADVLVGSGSLNVLDDGTYWVLSSRPSNGTLAISLTNRQLITE